MAVPPIASVSNDLAGNTSGDITCTFASDGPSGTAAGDLIVVLACSSTLSGGAFATPADFDVIGASASTVGPAFGAVAGFSKVLVGGETSIAIAGTPDEAGSGLSAKVLRWAAGTFDPNDPIHVAANTAGSAGDVASYAVTGVTTTVVDCKVLYVVGFGKGSTVTTTWSGGPSELYDFSTDPTRAASLTVAEVDKTTPGASGTGTATPSAAANAAGFAFAVASMPSSAGNNRRLLMGIG